MWEVNNLDKAQQCLTCSSQDYLPVATLTIKVFKKPKYHLQR